MRSRPIFEIFLRSEIETLYNITRDINFWYVSIGEFLSELSISIYFRDGRKEIAHFVVM